MDTAYTSYCRQRIKHWNEVIRQMDTRAGWGGYYHQRLIEAYQYLVAPGQRVLEMGCGMGNLLSALKPSRGVGVDFSEEMIKCARQKYPDLHFILADAHELNLHDKFDVIILSDLLNDLWDVQTVFERIASLSTPHTRLIINSYNRLWELPLTLAGKFGFAKPRLYQNWLTV